MSNFTAKAIHPITGEVEEAQFLDDYYGAHEYAVRFPDGYVYRESQVTSVINYPGVLNVGMAEIEAALKARGGV